MAAIGGQDAHSNPIGGPQAPQIPASYGQGNTRRLEVGIMNGSRSGDTPENAGWAKAARSPWAVVCAVATVILGPAAVTATALDQANRAPLHHAVGADRAQAYVPTDTGGRRRTAA